MSDERADGSPPDYQRDTEFRKLATRDPDIDLIRVALEIARDAWPELRFEPTLNWIAARAAELREPFAAVLYERDAIELLAESLHGRFGLNGSDRAFDSADSSYLHRVIELGEGIPLSLSLIYMAVGQQAGLALLPVSAPQHFVCRCEAAEGPLYVDAFTNGRLLSEDECLQWLADLTDYSPENLRIALEPAGPRLVVKRMLNNLKVVYAQQEDWTAAWKVQHRLSFLQPGAYQERRDLGILSLHAGHAVAAIDLLSECLRTCPESERDVLKQHLDAARSRQARWN